MRNQMAKSETPVGDNKCDPNDVQKISKGARLATNIKLNVFVSSKCDNEKYRTVRKEIKELIEETGLANVYIFEEVGASTLTAEDNYLFALESSDVCIFLIDNYDGVTPGVQKEIDKANRQNKKSLYYFCDERRKKKTPLEQSLMGARFAKSTTIHKFEDLSHNGARDLINDIISIYRYYCMDKITIKADSEDNVDVQTIKLVENGNSFQTSVPKSVVENVDKCKEYIFKFIMGYDLKDFDEELEKTSKIDEWCCQFLPILLEGRSIKNFNTKIFLDILGDSQSKEINDIIRIRWDAVQAYFLGDIDESIKYSNLALKKAKESKQPMWIVNDILIDLRNQNQMFSYINCNWNVSEAQKELSSNTEEVYYPLLDRLHSSLHEIYIKELFKKKTESPNTIISGDSRNECIELLASSFLISMYYGSLTHILFFYNEIKDFLFYLSNVNDNWKFKRDMLKVAVYIGRERDIQGIVDSYPEILNKMEAEDAILIMKFCDNHSIKYKKFNSRLLALKVVGYYLSDEQFSYYSSLVIKEIKELLLSKKDIFIPGSNIFKCLSGCALRIPQEILSEICCVTMEKHLCRLYTDMFSFIGKHINLNKMNDEFGTRLIGCIVQVIENENERNLVKYVPLALPMLRKQNRIITQPMDQKISELMPDYYEGIYKLETSENKETDMPKFIKDYVKHIRKNNEEQSKNGKYFMHSTREYATIRAILCESDVEHESNVMDDIISVTADTILLYKEEIDIKLDAISLLICIAVKYPEVYNRNKKIYENLIKKEDNIKSDKSIFILSNIDRVSLDIALQFLNICCGMHASSRLPELMPYTQDDIATTISVERIIVEYMELSCNIILPTRVESIVLYYVLQWIKSYNTNVRYYAVKILFMLLRNKRNKKIINRQILNIIDSDNVYIKNLIINNIHMARNVSNDTYQYVFSKCKNDSNYAIRMLCQERLNTTDFK